jgi:hypothetical protein
MGLFFLVPYGNMIVILEKLKLYLCEHTYSIILPLQMTYLSDSDDEIYDDDCDFLDADKEDKHYYIGLSLEAILLSSVSPGTFFKYNTSDVLQYLVDYSATDVRKVNADPKVQILQLHVDENAVYNVVDKTYWLKLVQRSWKRVYAQRQLVINARKNPRSLLHRQTTGKWETRIPSIRDMFIS